MNQPGSWKHGPIFLDWKIRSKNNAYYDEGV